jgi:tripartite-type tricarboxylate transporter receptor subunit TctC
MKRNILFLTLCLLISLSMAVTAAIAADQPFKGVTLIVVNNAGGNSDSMKKFAEPWNR